MLKLPRWSSVTPHACLFVCLFVCVWAMKSPQGRVDPNKLVYILPRTTSHTIRKKRLSIVLCPRAHLVEHIDPGGMRGSRTYLGVGGKSMAACCYEARCSVEAFVRARVNIRLTPTACFRHMALACLRFLRNSIILLQPGILVSQPTLNGPTRHLSSAHPVSPPPHIARMQFEDALSNLKGALNSGRRR